MTDLVVNDKGKRGRHRGGCPCQPCENTRIVNAAKAAKLLGQPVAQPESSEENAINNNDLLKLLLEALSNGEAQTEEKPAAITAEKEAPPAPAVTKDPLVIVIPFGNPSVKAKGYTQFDDMRGLVKLFDSSLSDIRLGKVYVPPSELEGRKGVMTVTIRID